MERIGLRVPHSVIAHSVQEARAALADGGSLALPVVIRPAFTLGGQGGGFAATTTRSTRSSPAACARARSARC